MGWEPDPDYILGQWWLDEKGNLLIQPRPGSGKPCIANQRAVISPHNLEGMAKDEDGYLHPEVAKALGLKLVPRTERTMRGDQYQRIGSTVRESDT